MSVVRCLACIGRASICALASVFLAATASASEPTEPASPRATRIVTIGGAVTETVFALGAGSRVIAVDKSSVLPEEVKRLPQVGYHRSISAEGVLAQKPDLVLMTTEAGPPAAVEALKASGVRIVIVEERHTLESAHKKIDALALAIGVSGDALKKKLDADFAALPAAPMKKPRVLALYGRGTGNVSVGGKNTAVDAMIVLAGGVNVVDFDGYKPVSTEGIVVATPDIILLPARGLEASGGVEGVLALPGVKDTPAGKARRVVAVEDLALLGFDHRMGEGVAALRAALLAVDSASPTVTKR